MSLPAVSEPTHRRWATALACCRARHNAGSLSTSPRRRRTRRSTSTLAMRLERPNHRPPPRRRWAKAFPATQRHQRPATSTTQPRAATAPTTPDQRPARREGPTDAFMTDADAVILVGAPPTPNRAVARRSTPYDGFCRVQSTRVSWPPPCTWGQRRRQNPPAAPRITRTAIRHHCPCRPRALRRPPSRKEEEAQAPDHPQARRPRRRRANRRTDS